MDRKTLKVTITLLVTTILAAFGFKPLTAMWVENSTEILLGFAVCLALGAMCAVLAIGILPKVQFRKNFFFLVAIGIVCVVVTPVAVHEVADLYLENLGDGVSFYATTIGAYAVAVILYYTQNSITTE